MIDIGVQLAGLSAAEMLREARLAEALGFSTVYLPDHLAYEQPGRVLDRGVPAWDPLTLLGALAAATRRIRLGTLVLSNPLRPPALVGRWAATLDCLSGGRAVLGMGAGWCRAEHEMMGIPLRGPRERVADLADALTVIRGVWGPTPPAELVIGGSGRATLELAGREADTVNLVVEFGRREAFAPVELARLSEQRFLAKAEWVRAAARAAGRPDGSPRLSTMLYVLTVTDDAAQARALAEEIAAPLGIGGEALRRSPVALIGTAEECAAELERRHREWGLAHVVTGASVRRQNTWERLGREVLASGSMPTD